MLLSCLVYSTTGEVFNLLTEDVAAHTAKSLDAEKLIMFSSDAGLRKADGELIHTLRPADARTYLEDQELSAEKQRLVKAALSICDSDILRASSATVRIALLRELFTRQGCGADHPRCPAYEHCAHQR